MHLQRCSGRGACDEACRCRGAEVLSRGTQVYRHTGAQVHSYLGIQVHRWSGKVQRCRGLGIDEQRSRGAEVEMR